MSTWIKLHRKILDNEIWNDITTFRLFTYLLLRAEYKDGRIINGVELKRGQYLRSYSKLGEDLSYKEGRGYKRVSKSAISRSINKLLANAMISVNETDSGTVFTIEKYEDYQGSDASSKVVNETTNDPLPERQQNELGTKERIKELKNIYTAQFEQFWTNYPRKKSKQRAFELWQRRIKHESAENLILCAKHYADECERNKTEERYIKHAGTFLSDKLDYQDYLSKPEKRPPLRVINGIPELVIATDEEKEFFADVRRKQAERNGVTVNW